MCEIIWKLQKRITEMVLPRERLRAVSTLEGSLARVLAHVIDQMFSACERLGAKIAPMRRLASVLPDVVEQVLFSRERF